MGRSVTMTMREGVEIACILYRGVAICLHRAGSTILESYVSMICGFNYQRPLYKQNHGMPDVSYQLGR